MAIKYTAIISCDGAECIKSITAEPTNFPASRLRVWREYGPAKGWRTARGGGYYCPTCWAKLPSYMKQ